MLPSSLGFGYNCLMDRTDVLKKLKDRAAAIRAMGATSLYVFGSAARDEAGASSDLDVFIDYDRNSRFNAFDLVGIKEFLEQELGLEVDITTRDGLHPMLRSDIERSALHVF
jgi:predicted nucleotidyltransferase